MSIRHIDAQSVKSAAAGKWLTTLQTLDPELSDAIAAKGRHVACPVHGGRDGFRLFPDANQNGGGICNSCGTHADGFALLMWRQGWTFPQALEHVASTLGMSDTKHTDMPAGTTQKETRPDNPDQRRAALRATWQASSAIDWRKDSLVLRYLRNRGLAGIEVDPPQGLRHHKRLAYWSDNKSCTYHPAMLAPIVSLHGEVTSLHRTYLDHNGSKAAVCSPKKLMPPTKRRATTGCAVRLYEAGKRLCVTEGIETALAIRLALGLPVWATVSAGGMECLDVPQHVREVCIYADNDASIRGQQAANRLADRLRSTGRKASIALPPTVGMDWLDVFNSQEVAA
ncbi:MAG: DUF7146 domain-containing protein [Oceanococcus sp.]